MNDAHVGYGNDARWADWTGWYETAYQDILTLMHNRHIWRNLIAMLQANTQVEHHTHINNWFTRCYSQSQSVGIRRQWDHRERRPTLGRLLYELARYPDVASRTRYEAALKGSPERSGWRIFNPADGEIVDAQLVEIDRQRLDDETLAARQWVNRSIAHVERDGVTIESPRETASFGDINRGLDVVATLLKKYYTLFHPGENLYNVTPDMALNWVEMFRVPWYSDKFTPVDAFELG